MPGNSIGKFFCVTTFGESHGPALGCIIDGVPPNIPICEKDIQIDLDRRKPGKSIYTTQRKEDDRVKILSGVFNGLTTGCSIGLLIENTDCSLKDYLPIKDIYRPSHADYSYQKKYGLRDYRGGGRSSARETTMRVAAGAIAKKYLFQKCNIKIYGFLSQIGNIYCDPSDLSQIEKNSFFCPNIENVESIASLILKLKKEGDSVGSKVTIIIENTPLGLGEPVFDRLDADIAHALMSINAVKGIEIGDGFSFIEKYGSESLDEMSKDGFLSNHSGGIIGGISNGQPIVINIAIKPTSSIRKLCRTINTSGEDVKITTKGRHDPCIGIRVVPIAEAMVSIILMDHLIRNRAQCK